MKKILEQLDPLGKFLIERVLGLCTAVIFIRILLVVLDLVSKFNEQFDQIWLRGVK